MSDMKVFGLLGLILVASCSTARAEFDFGLHFLRSKLRSGTACVHAGAALAIDPERNYYLACHFNNRARVDTNVLTSSFPCDVFLVKYDQQTNCLWVRQIGNAGSASVAVHGTEAVFIAGRLFGETSAEGETSTTGQMALSSRGKQDVFLAKYDSSGNLLWFKQAGGPDVDRAMGIAVDPFGNSYITGEFRGPARFDSVTLSPQGFCDFFVAKYDPSGKLLWVKRDAGGFTEAQGIGVDAAGNVYATGVFYGSVTFGSQAFKSGGDMFLVKYDTDGNFLWARSPGGGGELGRVGHNVAMDLQANPHVIGIIQNTLEFGATNFVVVYPKEHENIFLAKYNADGEFQWVRQFRNGDGDFSNVVSIESVGVKRPGNVTPGAKSEPFAPLASEAKEKAVKTLFNVASIGTSSQQSAPLPVLRAQKSGEFVVLFWPREFAGFVLEGSETLTPFPVWETVMAGPKPVDDQLVVAIPIRDSAKFYRLRRP
jgi:hypothetical protein